MPIALTKAQAMMIKKKMAMLDPYHQNMVVQRMQGSGIFGDIWDWIKGLPKKIVDSKLISKGLRMIPGVGGVAGTVADIAGLGRKKRKRGGCSMKGSGRRHIIKA